MTLIHIAVFAIGAFIFGFVIPARWRGWVLLVASVLAIYWLQPTLPISPVDFALPTATIALGIIGWLLVREEAAISRENMLTLGAVLVVVLALAVIGPRLRIVPSAPGLVDLLVVMAALAAAIVTLGCIVKDKV